MAIYGYGKKVRLNPLIIREAFRHPDFEGDPVKISLNPLIIREAFRLLVMAMVVGLAWS